QDCKPVEAIVLPDGSYYLPGSDETIPANMATPSPDIASTIVPIIQWQMSLIAGVDRSGKANLRRDVSLLRRTLRSLKTAAKRGRGRVESDSAGLSFESEPRRIGDRSGLRANDGGMQGIFVPSPAQA